MVTKVLKIAFIGAKNTGKTYLCNMIAERYNYEEIQGDKPIMISPTQGENKGMLSRQITATIGVDLFIKNIQKKDVFYKLYLWDIGSSPSFSNMERFGFQSPSSIIPLDSFVQLSYMKNINIIILCFDAVHNQGINYIKYWYYRILQIYGTKKFIIVLTKKDLGTKNISHIIDEGLNFSQQINCPFIKTSSKNKTGISPLIHQIFHSGTTSPSPKKIKRESYCTNCYIL